MKRIIAIILVFIMMCCSGFAEVVRTDDAVVFLSAIDMLKQTKSRQSVAEAQTLLEGINSNYNQANMFGMYASAIVDIYDDNFDDAQNKLTVLQMNSEFSGLLKKYEMPDCSVLEQYIQARQAEKDGRFSEALEMYTSMNFLDSLDRSVQIIGESKENLYAEAVEYYSQGEYVKAANLFEQLQNYRDSKNMAKSARDSIKEITAQDLGKLKSIDESNVNVWGNGNFMDQYGDVMFGILIEIDGLQESLELYELSWAEDYEPFNDMSADEWQLLISDGITLAHCDEMDYGVYGEDRKSKYIEIALPDDPKIEGEQDISFMCCNTLINIKIKLVYLGSYKDKTKETGWLCEFVSCEISDILN